MGVDREIDAIPGAAVADCGMLIAAANAANAAGAIQKPINDDIAEVNNNIPIADSGNVIEGFEVVEDPTMDNEEIRADDSEEGEEQESSDEEIGAQ
jgi:hypothetical protein